MLLTYHGINNNTRLYTVWWKILIGESIDKFDEFPAIRHYFPYQIFLFSWLATYR